MKKKLFASLFILVPLLLSGCQKEAKSLEIELDEFTPMAYVGEEYDFTDVLYVEDDVKYELEVYYQNYKTKEEFSLPVEDTFYFTPVDIYDLAVIVHASKGNQKAQRTRIVHVSLNPEKATRYNLEMCNFEPGQWRGTGSSSEISYTETYGTSSKASRLVKFKNSWDLPEIDEEGTSKKTVNASFNLATTAGLGIDSGIDAKKCMLSFDVKFSSAFYESNNVNKHMFIVRIEDEDWIPNEAELYLVDDRDDFTYENTDNGWLHVEQNLSDVSELDTLGSGTLVITFGFYGITNETQEDATAYFDNIALTELDIEDQGVREIASRYNIEMCRFERGEWRGTGSKAQISYTEVYGDESTSSRLITFKNSEDLPDEASTDNVATVNASFNLANTKSIGVDNEIDAKACTLSFDVKLSEEFFNSINQYKHMYSIKIEDEEWVPNYTWLPMVDDPDDFTYANTDNGWMHVTYDLSTASELVNLGSSTYVITFGFFGITNTTKQTASIVFDNIALTSNN